MTKNCVFQNIIFLFLFFEFFIKTSFLNEGQEESSDVDEQFIVFENEVKEKIIHKT